MTAFDGLVVPVVGARQSVVLRRFYLQLSPSHFRRCEDSRARLPVSGLARRLLILLQQLAQVMRCGC